MTPSHLLPPLTPFLPIEGKKPENMILMQRSSELTEHNIEQKTTAATAARAATAATAETAATTATASTAATTATALNLLPEKQRYAKVV